MALGNQPKISGDDIIAISKGTKDKTVIPASTDFIKLVECVNKVPNFFPSREVEEYRVLDKIQTLSIQGQRPAIDGTLDIYLNKSFGDAYLKMVDWQNQPAEIEGDMEAMEQNPDYAYNYFWFAIYKKAEDRTIYCPCTIDDKLPNSQEESGGLDIYSLTLTNVGEALEENGDTITDKLSV